MSFYGGIVMIAKKSKKRLFGLVSTALAVSILMQWLIIPKIQSDNTVLAAEGEWNIMNQDSSSLVNFATILRGAVDYGIVSNSINQQNHMETTFATYTFINPNGGNNNDVDFLDRDKTAHFLIGGVEDGSYIRFGQTTAQYFNIQGPESLFTGFDPNSTGKSGHFELDNLFFTYRAPDPAPDVITSSPIDTNSNIERLIDRGVTQSQWLSDRANNAAYQLPSEYISYPTTNSIQIDITDPIFDNRVVYINVDADMMRLMRNTGDVDASTLVATQGLVIRKNPSSVVVFNIEDSVVDEVFGADQHYVTSKYIVVSGSDIMESQTASSGNTGCEGKSTVNYQGIDTGLCQTVIWNIRTNNDVDLDSMAGTILIPEPVSIDLTGGHSAGWLLTSGDVQLHKEFHYIYGGSSIDGEDEMHFAIRKAFTQAFASEASVVPDRSVVFNSGDFQFIWQEYTDITFAATVGASSTCPVSASSDVSFPVLTFYTDSAHAGTGEVDTTTDPPTYPVDCDPHYVLAGSCRDFYFRITESSNTLPGITNSGGDVKIRLRVTSDAEGNLTYQVQSKTTTGVNGEILYASNGSWGEDTSWAPMSGVRFDLGAFYNRVDSQAPGMLRIEKTVLGCTPTQDLEYTFNVYSEDNGVKTYYSADGSTSSDPVAIGVTVAANSTTGSQLVQNLPVGLTYTVVEVNPESVVIDGYSLVEEQHIASGVLSGSVAFASINNTYVRQDRGTISLSKLIGNGNDYAAASSTVYKIAVYQEVSNQWFSYTNYYDENGTAHTVFPMWGGDPYYINVTPGHPVLISNLNAGTYYVMEVDAEVQDYELAVAYNGDSTVTTASVNVTNGTLTPMSITNTYTSQNPQEGSLKILKDAGTGANTSTFTVTVLGADNLYYRADGTTSSTEVTISVPAGTSGVTIADIPVQTYTVTEVNPSATAATGYTFDVQNSTTTVNVTDMTDGGTSTAQLINRYTQGPTTGSLVIRKTISGAELNALEQISFSITGPDQLSVPNLCMANVGVGADQWHLAGTGIYEYTFISVSVGTYSVIEGMDGHTTTYTLDVDNSTTSGSAPVSVGGTAVIELTDAYTQSTTPTDPTEPTTPTESSSSDETVVVVPGSLIISKTISGTSLNELETITFVLTDTTCGATRDVPALTMENVNNGIWQDAGNGTYYYVVDNLTPGVTYSVVESLDGHTSTYTLDVANSVTVGTAMVVSGGTVTVTLTDAYTTTGGDETTPETDTPDETTPSDDTEETTPEVTSVTLDGQPLEPGSYTVNPDGSVSINQAILRSLTPGSHTIVVTYVNGASRSQTIMIDEADRSIGSTGEASVNAVSAVIMLSALVMIYFARKLREDEQDQ